MAKQRTVCIEIPKSLLEQISQRSYLNGRSRNAEFRYLIDAALAEAGDLDIVVKMPKDQKVKSGARFDYDIYQLLKERSATLHRGLGPEIVRLAAYAIQRGTDRDLEVIRQMLNRGSEAHDTQ